MRPLGALLLIWAATAAPKTCIQVGNGCGPIPREANLFVGEVVESRDTGQREHTGVKGYDFPIFEMKIRVVEAFQGPKRGEIVDVLITKAVSPGDRLSVDAHRGGDGKLRAFGCSGPPTLLSAQAADCLRLWKRGRATSGLRLEGVPPGSTVTISGPARLTVRESEYYTVSFDEIPAGRYSVRIESKNRTTNLAGVIAPPCGCHSVSVEQRPKRNRQRATR